MKRRLFIKINGIAVAAAVGLSACNDDTAAPGGTTQPTGGATTGGGGGGNHTIVVVPKDSTNPWFVRMDVGVKRYAADTGLDVYQKGPATTDATQQAQVIRDLIAAKVSALCVVPVDPGALEPVLKEAMDAGIVVVTHEGATQQNTQYNLEAFNNSAYGGFIMDNLAEGMGGEGLYTTMVGHVTNASHNEWADGGVAHQLEKYPNMKLLEAEPRVESQDDGEVAYQKAKELIKKYPDLKGIMGTSSFDAPGVARAIEELSLQGKFFTAGTGMPEANKQILEKGLVHALTLWDPAEAGYAMAELARRVLDKEPIEAPLDLKAEGYSEVKFAEGSDKILEGAGWIVITKDNVDSFGF
ncbi:MAG TPA: autoinducer 2 ABC transporter substrate-binding protein [Arachnia sp.]|nr:autoinducer 2 ABC transporter substrate-binding protein [Arachnia sp.]HMR12231.1 autoinducer 2 ABC transporter substrate-binding protein [Arachnia sp.]